MRTLAVLRAGSPFEPDRVLSPVVRYDHAGVTISYPAQADHTTEIVASFEGVDSVRASRGEISPYWEAQADEWSPVSIVQPSAWLRERHAYEAEHYGDSYEWGRGADTMLEDTHHYLFLFHDEFVEVLARGVWFEFAATPAPHHPFKALGPETRIESGDGFEVRRAARSDDALLADARLCSQPVYQLFRDGETTPSRQIRLRASLDGSKAWSDVSGWTGVEERRFEGIPSRDEALADFRR